MADKAKHITMLQRSPGYIMSMPQTDPYDSVMRYVLPTWMVYKIIRIKFLFPALALLQLLPLLPQPGALDHAAPHRPLPAQERARRPALQAELQPVGAAPLRLPGRRHSFDCLHKGKADIATGHIKTVTETGVTLESGQQLKGDIIVTATGLKLSWPAAQSSPSTAKPTTSTRSSCGRVSCCRTCPTSPTSSATQTPRGRSAPTPPPSTSAASSTTWTPTTTRPSCRGVDEKDMQDAPFLNLNSTYVKKAAHTMPKSGTVAPWKPRKNYFTDMYHAKFGDMTQGLQYFSVSS
ncbi:hypothetical protein MRB53_037196 [Persea americana]|nr:hypothetical protein MRB53_037196 [Persea americana]